MPRTRQIKVDANDRIIEFRFNCPASLREQVAQRLKDINYDRSSMMCAFLREWLKQTDNLVDEKKSSPSPTPPPASHRQDPAAAPSPQPHA